MKLKNILLTISLMVCSPFVLGQTILLTNPPRLDVDSNPQALEFELIMEGDTVPWVSSVEGDWVTIEPVSGDGPATIFIQMAGNFGPRRTARIFFEAAEGEAEPYTLEIRQHQAMPTVMTPVDIAILDFAHIDPHLIPYTGRVSFNYEPQDTMLFFNLVARKDDGSSPAWLVRNIPLPEARWHDSIQPISARFDLGLLGYEFGEPVEMLQYSYTLSYEPDTIIPWVPEYSYLDTPTYHSLVDAIGRILEDILVPDTVKTYFTPDSLLPFEITDKYYIDDES